jgi:branched-chain amino acid transport system substrate-binding protein
MAYERRKAMNKRIDRRSIMKSTAVGGTGLLAATGGLGFMAPRSVRADGPLKILNASTFSGAYADWGMLTSRGVELAVEHFGGKVLGRPIEVIERDIPTPAEAVRKAKEAVESLGCEYILTSPSSATALAIMEYAAQKGVVMLAGGASDKITGEACNKYAFRLVTPCWGGIRETVPRIIDEFKATTFYTITPQYVFGEDLLRNTKEVLKERGKELIGNSYHPIGETEYSPYLTKAMTMKPDCVLFLNFSGDTVNSLKQAANFGLRRVSKIAVAWGGGVTQMAAIGARTLEGTIFGIEYFYKIDSPVNNRLQAAYQKKYGKACPFPTAGAYASLMIYLEVVRKAGSTDPQKVVETWEGFETEGLTGRETWRACDHQCIRNFYTVRCKGPNEMKHEEDFADIVGYSKHYLPCEQTGCKMT